MTDLDDRSLVAPQGREVTGAYESVIRRLPAVMDALPFLTP